MDTITLSCDHCGKEYAYPKYKLSAHLGKKVKVRCKKCNNQNHLQIDVSLLNGENQSHTDIYFGETKERSLNIKHLILHDPARPELVPLDLEEGVNILGRKTEEESPNKVNITSLDQTVSRNHCQIEKVSEDGSTKFLIKDLGSTNGTFINEEQLTEEEEVFLMPGDTVKLGNVEIKATH